MCKDVGKGPEHVGFMLWKSYLNLGFVQVGVFCYLWRPNRNVHMLMNEYGDIIRTSKVDLFNKLKDKICKFNDMNPQMQTCQRPLRNIRSKLLNSLLRRLREPLPHKNEASTHELSSVCWVKCSETVVFFRKFTFG